MERGQISKFKAMCLALLDRVKRTGRADSPAPPPERPASWLGSFRGTARIIGDILSPAAEEEEWEVLNRTIPTLPNR
ncbi:type II toxin-antitoxin system Phd/YefM family antitoxin [Candidatus Poribacteria bacterium]|nr:MAG: type II toxin-antitoxin system Phd/YefM family antitoxin [Candidatus Poribacteria bacterium]